MNEKIEVCTPQMEMYADAFIVSIWTPLFQAMKSPYLPGLLVSWFESGFNEWKNDSSLFP